MLSEVIRAAEKVFNANAPHTRFSVHSRKQWLISLWRSKQISSTHLRCARLRSPLGELRRKSMSMSHSRTRGSAARRHNWMWCTLWTTMTMTMTQSKKVIQQFQSTWPNGHEWEGHDPAKKESVSRMCACLKCRSCTSCTVGGQYSLVHCLKERCSPC